MLDSTVSIGRPVSRVDGREKVTGTAKYAAEFEAPDLAYGVVVSSAIAKGRILKIITDDAEAVPGMLRVITHENRPEISGSSSDYRDDLAPPGSPFKPLYDDRIRFSGQPIAIVIAEELEIALYAASLIKAKYEIEEPAVDLKAQRAAAYVPPQPREGIPPPSEPRGDAEAALAKAKVKSEQEYISPTEHHNPMEMHATTAVWEGDGTITIYDKNQGVQNVQRYLSKVFSIPADKLRVISPFVGGAFGSGLRPQYQVVLAVMATIALERSVRIVLTRKQMFTFTHRPWTIQKVSLGARKNGALTAIEHHAFAETSTYEDYQEDDVNWSGLLYTCDNTKYSYGLAKLDVASPGDMRAPGGVTSAYALECAMDELAYAAKIDPLELRLKNYSDRDQLKDRPYTSKELRKCYIEGAERFGWSKRKRKPRSMREGKELVGWGMATGIWEALHMKTSAKVALFPDGKLEVSSATADIGTGTYTIMTQIAADLVGVPLSDVTARLGDSALPESPVEGGSWTAASVGSSIHGACMELRKALLLLAQQQKDSPLAGVELDDVTFADGEIRLKSDPSRKTSIREVMRHSKSPIEREAAVGLSPEVEKHYSHYTHSAVFAEVKVDEEIGLIRVTRIVSAIAAGRIINPTTARSQVMGAIVGGIGMALQEETVADPRYGRYVTQNFADYHVPVNADVHDIDVIFVDERDELINPLGVKGVGEIGIVGVAAAIANAVYHATGIRVRDLPITIDKVMPRPVR